MKLKSTIIIFVSFFFILFNSDLLSYNPELQINSKYFKRLEQSLNQVKKYKVFLKNKVTNSYIIEHTNFQQFNTLSAREKLDTAIFYAKNYSSDAELKAILLYEYFDNSPYGDTIDGKSFTISYYFYSNQKGKFALHYSDYGVMYDTTLFDFPFTGGTVTIDNYFVDSDTVSFIAETNGGFDFRSEPATLTTIFYELRNLSTEDIFSPDTINIYWKVTYYKTDTTYNPKEFLIFYINRTTGEIVNKFRGKFEPVTVKQYFASVDSIAKSAYQDAKLMYVLGFEDSEFDGKSMLISYGYKRQNNFKFSVNLLFGVPVIDTSGWIINDIEFNRELNVNSYLDSDTLVSVGELNGGKTFRETYQLISGGFIYSQSMFDTSKIYFHSIYNAIDSTTGYEKNLFQIVDPVTGNFIQSILLKTENEISFVPKNYILYQNYPNPFNSITKLRYFVPEAGNISIKIYDILGREIETLVSEYQNAGEYEITFNSNELPSGIYIYVLTSNKITLARKMTLIK